MKAHGSLDNGRSSVVEFPKGGLELYCSMRASWKVKVVPDTAISPTTARFVIVTAFALTVRQATGWASWTTP